MAEILVETAAQALSGPLRKAIAESERSHYAIARDADIESDAIRRFAQGAGGMNLATADRLFRAVGLAVGATARRDGDIPLPIADAIRSAIERAGLASRALGRASGVHPQAIREFMSGASDLNLATADRLASALGLVVVRAASVSIPRRPPVEAGWPIADAIRSAIERAGGPRLAADASGVKVFTLSRFFDGRNGIFLATADRLASALGLALSPKGLDGVVQAAGHFSSTLRQAIEVWDGGIYELARVSGIDHQAIRHFLNHVGDMKLATADRLASALGLRVADVSPGSRIEPPSVASDSLKCSLEAIRSAGIASGISPYALSRKAGLSDSTVRRFLAGAHRNLGHASATKLAMALGLELDANPPHATADHRSGNEGCPFRLQGRSAPPEVGGRMASKPLSAAAYDIIDAMIALHKAGKPRNPESVIANKSGRSNPVRTLNRLRKDPLYDAHLFFPGENVHGGYGFKWPSRRGRGADGKVA